jgi:DNA polymerase-4
MERRILHFDMDAFFASVEQVDNPNLKDKPVIVGGTGSRGVVSTCSYEARKFGVRSAMPIYMAKAKCPNGVFLPPRHQRYCQVSDTIFGIFEQYSAAVEKLSIDEAFLDLTGNPLEPIDTVKRIKQQIMSETGLTVSAGISYNKFLAKLASDWNKPDGLFVITADMVPDILFPLNVDKVYGIGKKTAARLNSMGIYTIKDLWAVDEERLIYLFGKQGSEIFERIRGIDNSPVISHREVKSISRETTLEQDAINLDRIKRLLFELCKDLSQNMYNKGLFGKTIGIKVKTASLKTITRSRTTDEYIQGARGIYRIAVDILENLRLDQQVRLIGVTVSNLSRHPVRQLSVFGDQAESCRDLDEVVLRINSQLGDNVLKFGIELQE